jgi:hypothetical protein
MTERTHKRWGPLKIGCVSITIVVGVSLVWMLVVVGSALLGTRSESIGGRELERDVAASTGDPATTGRVVLDFTVGEFFVEAGEAGEPIRVEARYDTTSYVLEESFEPSDPAGWIYRVTFRQTGWIKDGGLRILFGASYPRVRVYLPPDIPIALEGRFGKGGAELYLGGLWLTEIDLDLDKGALDVGFDRPLVAPVRSIRIRGRQGGLSALSLGEASPAELDVSWRMGGSVVDLNGRWRNDAEVRVRNLMGGATVVLPDGVRIEGLSGHAPLLAPADEELPPPTLRMSTSSFMGGLDVVD